MKSAEYEFHPGDAIAAPYVALRQMVPNMDKKDLLGLSQSLPNTISGD